MAPEKLLDQPVPPPASMFATVSGVANGAPRLNPATNNKTFTIEAKSYTTNTYGLISHNILCMYKDHESFKNSEKMMTDGRRDLIVRGPMKRVPVREKPTLVMDLKVLNFGTERFEKTPALPTTTETDVPSSPPGKSIFDEAAEELSPKQPEVSSANMQDVQEEINTVPLKRMQDDAEEVEDELIRSSRTPNRPKKPRRLQKVKVEGSDSSKKQRNVLHKTRLPRKPQHKPVVDFTVVHPTRKGKRSTAYRKWKVSELRDECAFRELSTQGLRDTLIDRLCNDDDGIEEEEEVVEEVEEEKGKVEMVMEEEEVEEEENTRASYDSVSNQSDSDYE